MNALEVALFGRLGADATLVALLGAATEIYPDRAGRSVVFPYIVYTLQPGSTDEYTYGRRAYEELDYLIKAVDAGVDSTAADAIMERVDALLTNQALTVTGYTLGRAHRLGRVNYPETADAGDQYVHRGGIWRFMLDPTGQ